MDSKRESSSELMAIFENAAIVLILVDKDRKVVNINKAGLDTTGGDAEGVLGHLAGQLLNCVNSWSGDKVVCGTTQKCEHCNIKNPIDDTFQTGKSYYKEPGTLYVHSGDQRRRLDLLVSTSVVTIEKERYVLLTIDDVTQLKQQEKELKRLNADKDKFISILSHDLRSPMSLVLGLAELLHENSTGFDKEQIEEIAQQISDAANVSYELLDDLLAWAKSQSGKVIFDPIELNLKDNYDNVLTHQKYNAASKNITVSYEDTEVVNLKADKNMLRTVLRNLISNAVKFTPEGGTIKVFSTQEDDYTVITVQDSGVGMAPHRLPHLFRASHLESTIGTNGEKGSGFGLLLCKEFVEHHGGKIWAESTLGKGSQFHFSIPNKLI